ncbi:MAG: tetratricopeptide repeat protein [Pseudomonadales bacterium]|nr:tetratricopeptide repeat protein [Pseudomonadales bacterium]
MAVLKNDAEKQPESLAVLNEKYNNDECFSVVIGCNDLINAGHGDSDIWSLRGQACCELNQFSEAIFSFKKAISLSPDNALLYQKLGDVFAFQQDFGKAAVCFDEALKRVVSDDAALMLKTRLLQNAEAAKQHIQCKKQFKGWSRSHFYSKLDFNGRDEILTRFENDESLTTIATHYSQILNYSIQDAEVRNAIIMGYIEEGHSDIAYSLAKSYLEEEPDDYLHNLLLRSMLTVSFDVKKEFSVESIRWGKLWANHQDSTVKKFQFNKEIQNKSDIHVGLLSDYAFTIFGRIFFDPLATCLANTGLQVTFYNLDANHYTDSNKNYSVKNVSNLDIDQIHNMIIQDEITVLIDLNGRLRDEYTLDLFTRRSAPVQIMYFCLAGTTGISDFDFIIADHMRLPKEDEPLFVEDVIHLPSEGVSGFRFERDVPISKAPCLANGYVTFGTFNAPFKFNDNLLDSWVEILLRVPNSRIYIKCMDMARDRVKNRLLLKFKGAGIDEARIKLEGSSWLPYMRQCYKDVDIALDTYPHHGGSSNKHAIWQGVPVLTQMGNDWRSRITPSMMKRLGLDEFVTHSREEYVERAVALAQDRTRLNDIRFSIESQLADCVNFRPDLICDELSEQFLRICQEAQQG